MKYPLTLSSRWDESGRAKKKLKELAIEASKKKDFASCHCPWKLKKYGKAIALDSKEIIYYNNSAAVCFQMNLWTILTYASSFATKKIEPNQNSSSKVLKEWDDPSWKTRSIFAKMSSLLSIYVTHVYYLTKKIFFWWRKRWYNCWLKLTSFFSLETSVYPWFHIGFVDTHYYF